MVWRKMTPTRNQIMRAGLVSVTAYLTKEQAEQVKAWQQDNLDMVARDFPPIKVGRPKVVKA